MTNVHKRNTSDRAPDFLVGQTPEALRGQSSSDADSRYSRDSALQRYTDTQNSKRRHNNTAKKIALALLLLIALGLGSFFGWSAWLNGNLGSGLGPSLGNFLTKTNLVKEPFYMVLLGTDESIDRNETMSTDGVYRTDTIILARIDAPNQQITLVSLQRDTQITIPGEGAQKLNAAYTFGGPELAVSTVSDLAGVGISHFALIDMNGIQEIVDSLGGIEVNVPMEIWDEDAGGYLQQGPQTLDGWEALILCRAREAYAEYGNGDVYRTANQRLVLQAIAQKLLASDPIALAETASTLSGYVQTDLKVEDIVTLAQAFQGMDTENNLWTANMPTESFMEDGLWYERILQPNWQTMMDRVDKGLPPTESSSIDFLTNTILSNAGSAGTSGWSGADLAARTGTIAVRNGSGVDGLAATVQLRLEAQGYTVTDIGNADTDDYEQTVVVYEDENRAQEAADIVAVLGEGHVEKNDWEYIMSEDFLVVLGRDFVAYDDE